MLTCPTAYAIQDPWVVAWGQRLWDADTPDGLPMRHRAAWHLIRRWKEEPKP